MGNGGETGSPLARPYLHFAYNFLVVVPTVCAFLDQTKFVRDGHGADVPGRGDVLRRRSPARAVAAGGG